MTNDEAILAMTDDNLRHREKILPMEKAQSLKMQVEAISHQGTKMEGVAAGDVGKRSTEIVGGAERHELQAGTAVYPADRACAGAPVYGEREKPSPQLFNGIKIAYDLKTNYA